MCPALVLFIMARRIPSAPGVARDFMGVRPFTEADGGEMLPSGMRERVPGTIGPGRGMVRAEAPPPGVADPGARRAGAAVRPPGAEAPVPGTGLVAVAAPGIAKRLGGGMTSAEFCAVVVS